MYSLDPTWLPFNNLMLNHIYNVLLICNDYDRFLLEEDGRVEEELYLEYTQLRLSNPPKITHASSAEEALGFLKSRTFELVITMLDLGVDSVEHMAASIKEQAPHMPIIALSPSPAHRRNKLIKGAPSIAIDYFFYWQGDPTIFLAMVKLVEDRMNLSHDTQQADVQLIILVEDSVGFYSTYLPLMYTCLIQQNRLAILEALNNWGRTLRMRGRPKIALARTYEEAWELYSTYRNNVLGVICDVAFDKQGVQDEEAGFILARQIRALDPNLPILMQSGDDASALKAQQEGLHYLSKESYSLYNQLEHYMAQEYGFGPFIFRDPLTMAEIGRVTTMKELQHILPSIPANSFAYHSSRDDFSKWLRAQSLYQIAARIKNLRIGQAQDPRTAQQQLYEVIRSYREERTKGVIAQFSYETFDETLFFSRIGQGSLGGKGRGLAFINLVLRSTTIAQSYPSIYLSIPRTIVIATDIFVSFIEENNLEELASADVADEALLAIFLAKPLSNSLVEHLKHILDVIHQPISVRSSSLLEDSHYQPFAGVYETIMLPNRGSEESRLKELGDAIKTVWASTYFRRAKEYLKATGYMLSDEKMAIIIQQVIGSEHGPYWYPNASGVARSLNYYPPSGEKAEDGVGMVCFGFGKAVVDAGSAISFSPVHPKRLSQYVGGSASPTQQTFYALNLSHGFDPLGNRALDNLSLLEIEEAQAYPQSLRYVASTIDTLSGTYNESIRASGRKIITFNGILKYDAFPLASIVKEILAVGVQAMGRPIEIEFALNLNRQEPKKPEFSLLQIRPIALGREESDVTITTKEQQNALIYAKSVLGNGMVTTLTDIIYVNIAEFDPSHMSAMASELEKLNAKMVLNERDYILLVAGRLGSSDPWLGIPVPWSHISRSKVIIETGLKGFQVEPSQGTHFFQNLTSLGCLYLTINPEYGSGTLDIKALSKLTTVEQTAHFIHAQAENGFVVKVNGFTNEGVILF
ncbi:MAG: PEP/pyruvate-binding domain-containing protein [Sphaerochaetaceae bacterium]